MDGAELLVKSLVENSVDVCFSNPGTSEMHFVAALDSEPRMRSILCLFEGVCSGAADGYARIAGKPGATLLHLGAGLSNASANLHNAKKAHVPMLNIVGDHALRHQKYETPLRSDVTALAKPVSDWVQTAYCTESISSDVAMAISTASQRKIASLILPADVSWSKTATEHITPAQQAVLPAPGENLLNRVTAALQNNKKTLLLVGGIISLDLSHQLSQLALMTGAHLCMETFPVRMRRGAGGGKIDKLPYFAERAIAYLAEFEQIILLGANPPIGFFAYPGVPSELQPPASEIIELCAATQDIQAAVDGLLSRLTGAKPQPSCYPPEVPPRAEGQLTGASACQTISRLLPDNAIIVDEGLTSSVTLFALTQGAAPHDWMTVTGGSIGHSLPCATGAAVAAPGRKVICVVGDGSAMYTIQSLWTMARENLDVCTIIFNNAKYNILEVEFARTEAPGGKPGPNAARMFNLESPAISFVELAKGFGVAGVKCDTLEAFENALADALRHKGPRLIEAMIPPVEIAL